MLSRLDGQPQLLRFAKQRVVRADESDMIALFCSRRAGKTEEFVFEALEALTQNEDVYVLFIGLSIKSARNIFYKKFRRLKERHGWPLRFTDSSLAITCQATGSTCLIFGSDNISDIDKILGLSRIKLLIVDEAGAWRPDLLKYTIEEVVGPAMEDIEGSRTIVGGTPGRVLSGYWYDITTGKVDGWKVHSWTLDDNPYMPRDIRQKVLRKFGWTEETPAFVMQYLGRWCIDPGTLVFSRFSDTALAVRELKPVPYGHKLRRVLSLDFGVVHHTAGVVIENRTDTKGLHVPHSFTKAGMAPSEVADLAKATADTWQCDLIIGDLGGMGKAYAQEMLIRHKVNIIPADKRDKLAMLEMVNDGFATGTLTVNPVANSELVMQLRALQWNEMHDDIAEGQNDDLSEALSYGYKYMRPHYIEPPETYDQYAEPKQKPKRRAYYHVDVN